MRFLIAALLLLLPMATPVQAESAAPPTGCGFLPLGVMPLTGATTAGAAMDGDRVYTVTSSASGPAVLAVRNAADGSLIAERPLPLALGSWAVTVAPDHSVYVGSYNATAGAMGRLFRYEPAADRVTEIGIAAPGETFLWTVAASPDGASVYAGTSPSGKLVRYDTASGTLTDLGSPVPGQPYVRDLAIAKDGTVYAGSGAGTAAIAVLRRDGTRIRTLDSPVPDANWAYDLDIVGHWLMVRYTTSTGLNPMGVYDLTTGRWKELVPDVDSLSVGGGAHGHKVYLVQDDELAVYDLKSGTIVKTGFTDLGGGAARPLGWLPGDENILVGTASTGRMWHYDRRSGRGRLIDSTVTGQPVSVRSMGNGPDGRVYAGGFFTGGLAAFDPATGEREFWPNVGQSEGITTHRGKLYLGVYPGARIYEFEDGRARQLLSLTDQEQDRPFAMISAGDWLAFGTVPKAGSSGGVLGLLNPATGEKVIRRDLIPDQSIIALAHRDGVLYGATSAWGGSGGPKGGDGKLFAYDIATDKLLWQSEPVAGDLALGAITFDDAGKLWGLTPDALFEVDPADGTTLRSVKHQTYPWATTTGVLLDAHLEFHDGYLWGKTQAKVFKIDRATMGLSLIARPISIMLKGADGHLYLSRFENFSTYRIC
ncbi:hypothetical protein OIE66_23970 [Nonomuraea sp. NBC_01738]|uniref:hypothetical protein n=1 Tax=Nonomuraea sp. NBC_01738 TaxID=2976003 RepID=UPI002E13A83E|nr:hypothetical protein OIE66_23970 [Nonomuraea sp. NBC_01738]